MMQSWVACAHGKNCAHAHGKKVLGGSLHLKTNLKLSASCDTDKFMSQYMRLSLLLKVKNRFYASPNLERY
jgi:hypothetical protein